MPASVPLDQLLAHKAWLRRLARALVKDPNRADDLEQEVWLRAIRTPPATKRSLRGWLGTVLRRTAVDQHRADERRERHEGAIATRSRRTGPATARLAEQADTHRRVTEAVLALDEPYRGTLLMRYVGERSIKAVAHEQGVPVETVRTRLRRGLSKLRETLDVEYGGNKRWLAALVPLIDGRALAATALSGVAAGGLMMGAKATAIAVGVVVVGAAGWLLWDGSGTDAPSDEPIVGHEDETDKPRASLADAGDAPALEGRHQPGTTDPADVSVNPATATRVADAVSSKVPPGPGRIVGRITDAEGKGLKTVSIYVHPKGETFDKEKRRGDTSDVDWYFSVRDLDAKPRRLR